MIYHSVFVVYSLYFVRFLVIASTLMISPVVSSGGAPVDGILSRSLYPSTQTIAFVKRAGEGRAVISVQVHFLAATDCYSGYLNRYDTLPDAPAFPVFTYAQFALDAEKVYRAALSVMPQEALVDVHSILVRLISDHHNFARFRGTCKDQGINCCIPVVCSSATAKCLATPPMGDQAIVLS